MKEGYYRVDYQGMEGLGFALIALDNETVVGVDVAGGTYDGTYTWNTQTERLDVKASVWVPEGAQTVQGIVAPSGGLKFWVKCSFPREPDDELITATTEHGLVSVQIRLIRTFP